jgi:hypothetical protein
MLVTISIAGPSPQPSRVWAFSVAFCRPRDETAGETALGSLEGNRLHEPEPVADDVPAASLPAALILLGIEATGRSLETATAE